MLLKIKEAVESNLESHFSDVTVYHGNLTKGFPRPSFHTFLDNLTRDDHLYDSQINVTVRIFYFPPDRYEYSTNVMIVQDILSKVFKLNLPVEERVLTIEESRGNVIDGVLEYEFDVSFFVVNDIEEESEMMEELNLDV